MLTPIILFIAGSAVIYVCVSEYRKLKKSKIKKRLSYLRNEIRQERISYGEIAELQSLVNHIPIDDVELLEWAGVPEN